VPQVVAGRAEPRVVDGVVVGGWSGVDVGMCVYRRLYVAKNAKCGY
jgi:hypothetical protein